MAVTVRALGKSSGVAGVAGSSQVYQDISLLYLVLDAATRMHVLLRTKTETFTDFVDREAKRLGLTVVVNGIFFEYRIGTADLMASARPASEASPNGLLIDSQLVIGGRSAPQMFYTACGTGPGYGYVFGQGDPTVVKTVNPAAAFAPLAGAAVDLLTPGAGPGVAAQLNALPPAIVRTLAAVGGAGPLIINGLKYGRENKFHPGASRSAAKTGEPSAADAPFLAQRGNKTFDAQSDRGASGGKTVLAYSSAHRKLVVLVQPNGALVGIELDALRDKLADAGCDSAVFLDGGSSSCLWAGGTWHETPAGHKNLENTIGVGFAV